MTQTIAETTINIPSTPLKKCWLFERDGVTGELLETPTLYFQINNLKVETGIIAIRPFLKLTWVENGVTVTSTIQGDNIVVTKNRTNYDIPFTLTDEQDKNALTAQIVLKFNNDNGVSFNRLMLHKNNDTSYVEPSSEIPEAKVGFKHNFYANFYKDNKNTYTQIIKPNYDNITTKMIPKSEVTVIVPHLSIEDKMNYHDRMGLEYMFSTDQTININQN